MAKLRFRQENDQDTKIALYMSSKDGEEVKLSAPCDCDGQVSQPFVSLQCCPNHTVVTADEIYRVGQKIHRIGKLISHV